jgi:hypothetical protein
MVAAECADGQIDGLAMIAAIQHHDSKEVAGSAYRRVFDRDPGLRRLPPDQRSPGISAHEWRW